MQVHFSKYSTGIIWTLGLEILFSSIFKKPGLFLFLLNNLKTSRSHKGFPGGSVVKDSPANAGDTGSIPDMGRLACHRATKPVCHNY